MLAGGGTRSLEIFDPTKKEWTTVAGQLSTVRSFHAAALLQDGKVLIAGGRDGDVPLNSTDLFDPATGSVTPSGFLTVPRAHGDHAIGWHGVDRRRGWTVISGDLRSGTAIVFPYSVDERSAGRSRGDSASGQQ